MRRTVFPLTVRLSSGDARSISDVGEALGLQDLVAFFSRRWHSIEIVLGCPSRYLRVCWVEVIGYFDGVRRPCCQKQRSDTSLGRVLINSGHVRHWGKADIAHCTAHVRFRVSGKADMLRKPGNVR